MAKLTQEEKDSRNAKRKATIEAKKKAKEMKINQELRLSNIERCVDCGRRREPTRHYQVGEEVDAGNFARAVVMEIFEDGLAYALEVTCRNKDRISDKTIVTVEERIYSWFDMLPKMNSFPERISSDKRLDICFSQRMLIELIRTMYYRFGIDMEPEYQRDFVWEPEDKVALIDSIFRNVEIGKFALIHTGYDGDTMYEILDGKQRLNALVEFSEDRFRYRGLLYSELHPRDRTHFENYSVSVGESRCPLTRAEKLEYFLRLNTKGRDQSAKHIDKVGKMLNEEIAKEKEAEQCS